jgi:hypothetical protein
MRADDQARNARQALGQVLEEEQSRLVGPVEVFQNEKPRLDLADPDQ